MMHTDQFTPAQTLDLGSRAMLMSLSIKGFSGNRQDRAQSKAVSQSNGAEDGAARVWKSLVDPKAIKPVKQAVAQARKTHDTYTLPWMNDGTRILPADAFQTYAATMQKHRLTWEKAVDAFAANWSDHVTDAQKRLGSLFDPSDYATETEIRAAFTWSNTPQPLPTHEDFRLNIGTDAANALRAEIADSLQETLNSAVGDVYARAFKAVGHMAAKLKEFEPAHDGEKAQGVFRDSLVENVRDLAHVLPMLNVTGCAKMAALASQIGDQLTGFDAEQLRNDDAAREDIAAKADQIAADLAGFMDA